jgi:dynactin complex subunit
VELDEPVGMNAGTVGEHTYFACLEKHGVLCHPNKVTLLDVAQELAIGMRCVVMGYPNVGTVQFVGNHHVTGSARCGVELDAETGNNDGTVRGSKYFDVRCAFSTEIYTLKDAIELHDLLRLKLLHACDQWHSSCPLSYQFTL